ncbi:MULTISPECIES: AI-2E family transporter [Paraclostridium]|uniref:AI-2E family transporter n=1 Tax=Paraclostridium bifermentans TaxID=1490 RepID=A0A5P3X9T8_PARBF|nr:MULTISPECIES: AI-2E family transporter [Paraclostridium]MDV8112690.1 AI-2E family transporter [Bacillus sp. BAU-SS-2023]MBZ6004654.1 AI-2E family transporter [Paraclostridium bifermentans]MCE9675047.1 AI-2E family transporter [Paraclostridium bifermentans]MCR1874376.1 AI-2E family transporter [Paraclostridium bifermentans]MDU0297615.1 AI-2E family transporter [Paraclostridium sp. MRS3W1]
MKVNWNSKYTTISVYSFIVICCSIIFYRIASDTSVFMGKISSIISTLQPFIIGAVIAYLLNFILVFVEERMLSKNKLNKLKPKSKRAIGLLLTYIVAFILLALFIQFVLPQLVESMLGLVNDIPTYLTNLSDLLTKYTKDLNVDKEYLDIAVTKLTDFINYFISVAAGLLPVVGQALGIVASSIWNIVLGVIISIYLLIDKEKFCALGRKVVCAVFNEKHSKRILQLVDRSNDTFGKFLSGKIIDSAIIGVLTFVVLTIFKMPYVLLISVIIGITNIIPFFGPFFGAIPATIIILFVSPIKALWFILIIIVIQQLDGNIIGPKILGDSIGISAFWILFSLLVAGKFLGLVGMIIGVPLFAIIYSIIKEVIEEKLDKKGLPINTNDYLKK